MESKMKKSKYIVLVLLIGAFLILALAGCGQEPKEKVEVAITTPVEITTPSGEETSTSTSASTSSASESATEKTTSTSTETSSSSTETASAEGTTAGGSEEATSAEQTTGASEAESTTGATSLSGSGEGGFYADIKVTDISYGILMLINKQYRLPDDFEQDDLVAIPSNYHVADGKEYKMQKEAAEAFYKMSDAAWNESGGKIDLRIISGYRSHSYQDWLYNHYANTYGKEEADTYSARPRHSEHETGLCCDIDMVDQRYEQTESFKWLVNNAQDYGYILRYEKGKEHITGYMYEPWHWRYIGVETAQAVKESGLTYEEYFLQYIVGGSTGE